MKDHDLTPNYPSFAEFRTAVPVLLDRLRGKSTDTACAIKAAWIGAGYAGSFVPDSHPFIGAAAALPTPEESAVLLESTIVVQAQGDMAAAFDWRLILSIVLDLLKKFLEE